jgi:hypothetical protein
MRNARDEEINAGRHYQSKSIKHGAIEKDQGFINNPKEDRLRIFVESSQVRLIPGPNEPYS